MSESSTCSDLPAKWLVPPKTNLRVADDTPGTGGGRMRAEGFSRQSACPGSAVTHKLMQE